MIHHADVGNTDMHIEMLRREVLMQKSRTAMVQPRSGSTLETQLLVAMQLNLEIVKTNQSINPAPGVTNDHLERHVRR